MTARLPLPLWAGLVAGLLGTAYPIAASATTEGTLRVCADPNNLPFSDREGRGFENKIAELVAADLGEKLEYFWWAQRRGFLTNTLYDWKCDVVIGTPNLDALTGTRTYYRSSYVWVSRADRNIDLSSLLAPRLRTLRIGVQLIGDDGFNTPPAEALGEEGIVDNVVGYNIYGDYRTTAPPSALIRAVQTGDIDLAAAWGPLAGYYAARSPVPLRLTRITDTVGFLPLLFQYPVGMGVRHGDDILADKLNDVIYRRQADITAILEAYSVPLVGDAHSPLEASDRTGGQL
jgi:quinoprotein dehydrogenase-associated probable ABC transporter substrate-binding protein